MAKRDVLKAVFARIGQVKDPDHLTVRLDPVDLDTENGRDKVADDLYRYCARLMPTWGFTVTVDFTTGLITIDGGSEGRGRLEKA